MERKLLVLCDPEEDYVRHMAEFLCRKKEASWEVRTFTKAEELIKMEESIEILLIAETAYGEFVNKLPVRLLILLNESGLVPANEIANVDKYQAAEQVWQEILIHYIDCNSDFFPRNGMYGRGKLIGMYSPVKRCLQTTFALTYGQLLAEKHRTLYLSFEYYGGLAEWQEYKRQDLSMLLYYQQNKEKNFILHMQTAVCKVGNLDFVTPMVNGENLLYVTLEEWQRFLGSIVNSGEYEYIILDLSESMQGLFEILRMCSKIYTIVQEEEIARQKLQCYEQLLSLQEYEDVKEKTAKCHLPTFRKLPSQLEQYSKGELADYIRSMLGREEKNGIP